MALITKPPVLDESVNTTELSPRNVADVLAQELSGIASAITGGSDKAPKTDIATVEPGNTASRAYSVGELVYVNGNLYKVITAISIGATFTVGTNIQSTNVSDELGKGCEIGTPIIVTIDLSTAGERAYAFAHAPATLNGKNRIGYLPSCETYRAYVEGVGNDNLYVNVKATTTGNTNIKLYPLYA